MLPFKATATCPVIFWQEELDVIDRDDEQKFLSSADFLVTNAMPGLILNMQSAVSEVLKGYVADLYRDCLQVHYYWENQMPLFFL